MATQAWAGVDVGKDHHWICVVDQTGNTLLSRKVSNDEPTIVEAIDIVTSLADEVSWTVDLTSQESALLLTMLWTDGRQVRYLSGQAVNHAARIYRGQSKTDARDAKVIADQSLMRPDLPVLDPRENLTAELQMLTSHRGDLVADRVRVIARLRQQLTALCPALERAADPTRRSWLVLLTHYQRPQAIRDAGPDELHAVLADAKVRNPDTVIAAALAAADAQTVALPGEQVAAQLVAQLANHVLELDARIKTLDIEIAQRFRSHHLAHMGTHPRSPHLATRTGEAS